MENGYFNVVVWKGIDYDVPRWFRMRVEDPLMILPIRIFLERTVPNAAIRYNQVGGEYRFDMCLYGDELARLEVYLDQTGMAVELWPVENWREGLE